MATLRGPTRPCTSARSLSRRARSAALVASSVAASIRASISSRARGRSSAASAAHWSRTAARSRMIVCSSTPNCTAPICATAVGRCPIVRCFATHARRSATLAEGGTVVDAALPRRVIGTTLAGFWRMPVSDSLCHPRRAVQWGAQGPCGAGRASGRPRGREGAQRGGAAWDGCSGARGEGGHGRAHASPPLTHRSPLPSSRGAVASMLSAVSSDSAPWARWSRSGPKIGPMTKLL